MADIINYNSDRTLQLSGSECIFRSIDIPSGTVDLRFGVYMTYSAATNQAFSPTVSIYETFRMLFASGSGNNPPQTPYFGCGFDSGDNCVVSNTNGYVELKTSTGKSGLIYSSSPEYTTSSLSTNSTGYIIRPIQGDYGSTPAYGSFLMIRAYRESSTSITLSYRSADLVTIGSMTDSAFRNYMTNIGSTTLKSSIVLTSNNETNPIDSVGSVFFSWPFYNYSCYIPIIGYRALIS